MCLCEVYSWSSHNSYYCSGVVKAAVPVMHSRYQCGCVTLINEISAKAVMWLLLCSCVCGTNALLTQRDGNVMVMQMHKRSCCLRRLVRSMRNVHLACLQSVTIASESLCERTA